VLERLFLALLGDTRSKKATSPNIGAIPVSASARQQPRQSKLQRTKMLDIGRRQALAERVLVKARQR
jgi:hypothetical protein